MTKTTQTDLTKEVGHTMQGLYTHVSKDFANAYAISLFANDVDNLNVDIQSGPLSEDAGDIEKGTHVLLIRSYDLNYLIEACDAFIHDISVHRSLFLRARERSSYQVIKTLKGYKGIKL